MSLSNSELPVLAREQAGRASSVSTRSEATRRPNRQIDRVLRRPVGQQVGGTASSFCPALGNGEHPWCLILVREILFPDNTQPASLPVYLEGRLTQYWRRLEVVYACLESSTSAPFSAEGMALFRASLAAILTGPALMELVFPFKVEKLPGGSNNYGRDLHLHRAQFAPPIGSDDATGPHPHPLRCAAVPSALQHAQ